MSSRKIYRTPPNSYKRYSTFIILGISLCSCNMITKISEVGKNPKISQIQNPQARPDYKAVSLPMPAPKTTRVNPNSLWRSGARAFFKDHRAKEIGDLVTIKLTLSDSATFANKTARARKDSEDHDIADMLGLESEFNKVLPQAIEAAGGQIVNFNTDHSTSGDGSIARSEALSLTVAAVVTQILPNGSLVVMGRQDHRWLGC